MIETLFYIMTNFNDDALGAYNVETRQIYIQRGLKPEVHDWVLTHERSHDHWYHGMTEIQRRLFCRRFDRGKVKLVSEYAKTSCEEAYAELRTHNLLNK